MAYRHNDKFGREAVRIAQVKEFASGLTRKQVASDLGICFSTLGKWIHIFRSDTPVPASDLDLAKENDWLRKENRLLKEERDILKMATVLFAEQSK